MVERIVQNTVGKTTSHCPYCDEETQQAKLPWCQSCGIKLLLCPQCGKPVAGKLLACPHCGKKLPAE